MKFFSLCLVSSVVLVSFLVAGCSTTKTDTPTPTPPATTQPSTPTPEEETKNPAEVVPNADGTITKEANTETSTIGWNAKKVGGAHFGTVKLTNGSLDFDANNKLIGGTFTIDMNTITVDDTDDEETKASLLKHLQSDDFFSVANHPTSTFSITQAKEIAPNTYEITGNLTIKGITNPIVFVASVDESTTFTAPIVIDRTLWDIKFRSLKFFSDIADKAIEDTITYNVMLKVQ